MDGSRTQISAGLTLSQSLRDYRFHVIAFAILALQFGVGGTIANLVPPRTDRGFSPNSAGGIAIYIGLSIIVGRLLAGCLIDRYWAPAVTLPLLVLPALAAILLAKEDVSHGTAALSACLIGRAAGAESDPIAFLTARYFGLAHYGKIYGVLALLTLGRYPDPTGPQPT